MTDNQSSERLIMNTQEKISKIIKSRILFIPGFVFRITEWFLKETAGLFKLSFSILFFNEEKRELLMQ